jgi:hypothetical protein
MNFQLFSLGKVVATPGVCNAVQGVEIQKALYRHSIGDWGDALPDEDRKANNQALEWGDRLLSAYKSSKGAKFWIITERDRSYTTVLLPDEY